MGASNFLIRPVCEVFQEIGATWRDFGAEEQSMIKEQTK